MREDFRKSSHAGSSLIQTGLMRTNHIATSVSVGTMLMNGSVRSPVEPNCGLLAVGSNLTIISRNRIWKGGSFTFFVDAPGADACFEISGDDRPFDDNGTVAGSKLLTDPGGWRPICGRDGHPRAFRGGSWRLCLRIGSFPEAPRFMKNASHA